MPEKIRVMISSRVSDDVPFTDGAMKLAELRKQIKAELEGVTLLGAPLFDCWINEDAPPAAGADDSWELCLAEIHRADLVLVLYNGCSGWAKPGGLVGICHAELAEAMSSGAGKVRMIQLPVPAAPSKDRGQRARDEAFREYVAKLNLFRGGTVTTAASAIQSVREAVQDATVALARAGVRGARAGKYDTGEALDWSRLDFAARKDAMEASVADALRARGATDSGAGALAVNVNGSSLFFKLHGIPAATSVAAAREMVGRPFLRDYRDAKSLKKVDGGPVHIVACNRGVTEGQATAILGFPDATVVSSTFGVYVADPVQKIQLVFIANCRDQTSTRQGVQLFMEWLDSSGEGERLAHRANSRAKIVQVTADEQK